MLWNESYEIHWNKKVKYSLENQISMFCQGSTIIKKLIYIKGREIWTPK